jgi:hypothetical protein
LPYGAIRRVRDLQQDLNKRASKAQFLLNSNQLFMEEGAVKNIDEARDEAGRPDGVIEYRPGKKLEIRRDTDAATGQIQMMAMNAQSIQKSGGVADENMGRQTNAVSGEAIKARQLQGSVVTTEPFDNLRLATQVQGEKQLSMVEQFYSEEKVIRLTGARGSIEWVKINQPEQQPDGSVRYINDITDSMADFVVQEQDYAGTLRQVMFDSLNKMAQRLDPAMSMRLLTIAMSFSDLPNKDEIVEEFRKITGERDPNKQLTPEEEQQQQEQQAQQIEAMQMQREQAMQALEEQRGKVREINARAAKIESEIEMLGSGVHPEMERALNQARDQASTQIDTLSRQLVKMQSELANRTMQITKDAETRTEIARIDADARVKVGELSAASDKKLEAVMRQMTDLSRGVEEARGMAKKIADAPAPAPVPAPAPMPAPAPAPAAPVTINLDVKVDAVKPAAKKLTLQTDANGAITGGTVDDQP